MSWLDSLFLDPNQETEKATNQPEIPAEMSMDIMGTLLNNGIPGLLGNNSLLKFMDLMTGAMSNENASDEQFLKKMIKALYGILGEMLGMDAEEELNYLATIKQACEELIIEKAHLSITYLDTPEDENAATAETNGTPGVSGNSTGN